MKKVILGYLYHREKEWISVFGPDELVFNTYVKNVKAVWTKTHKCYLMPCNKKVAEQIRADLLSNYIIDIEPLRVGLLSRSQQPVLSAKSDNTSSLRQVDDQEAGLRDWELRYQ
jgi:hypothetical protein